MCIGLGRGWITTEVLVSFKYVLLCQIRTKSINKKRINTCKYTIFGVVYYMVEVKMVQELNSKGLYTVIDSKGECMDEFTIVKINKKHQWRYKLDKDMKVIDMAKKKYNPKTLRKYKTKENSLNDRELVVERIELEGDGRSPLIHIKVFEKDELKSTFKMSSKQVSEVRSALLNASIDKEVDWRNDVLLGLSIETVIYINLLKSPDYMISVGDLMDCGVDRNAAYSALEKLVKMGYFESRKNGRIKLYTCVIPRHKLAEMFKPYKEEIE